MKLAEIPIERILPSPHNPRHEAMGLEELAQSIRSIGIIEPLVVGIIPDDEEHVTLVCGFRRFSAAKIAGLKTVPGHGGAVGERAERTISLVENLHRRDMSPIEQGEAFRALMRTGMNGRQVAKATGVSVSTISIKVGLVDCLIPEIQDLIHRDHMTMAEGREMAKLPKATQRQIVESGKPMKRSSSVRKGRRTKSESALMSALDHFRHGSEDMALAEARRAVHFLEERKRLGIHQEASA